MKKPTKEPIFIEVNGHNYLDIYSSLTPDILRETALRMEADKISELYMEFGYDNCDLKALKLETPEQTEKRYQKELKQYERYLAEKEKKEASRKAKLIKEAKQLGLKVTE